MCKLLSFWFLTCIVLVFCQAQESTTPSSPTSTTPSSERSCLSAEANKSCSACLSTSGKCLWCERCMFYPDGYGLPPADVCPLNIARWGVCWMNFEAFLISIGIIAGVVFLTVTCVCLYCCCCRGRLKERTRHKLEADEARTNREREDRRVKSEEKKLERKAKYDEIRRKYGLIKDDQPPYERFDDGRESIPS